MDVKFIQRKINWFKNKWPKEEDHITKAAWFIFEKYRVGADEPFNVVLMSGGRLFIPPNHAKQFIEQVFVCYQNNINVGVMVPSTNQSNFKYFVDIDNKDDENITGEQLKTWFTKQLSDIFIKKDVQVVVKQSEAGGRFHVFTNIVLQTHGQKKKLDKLLNEIAKKKLIDTGANGLRIDPFNKIIIDKTAKFERRPDPGTRYLLLNEDGTLNQDVQLRDFELCWYLTEEEVTTCNEKYNILDNDSAIIIGKDEEDEDEINDDSKIDDDAKHSLTEKTPPIQMDYFLAYMITELDAVYDILCEYVEHCVATNTEISISNTTTKREFVRAALRYGCTDIKKYATKLQWLEPMLLSFNGFYRIRTYYQSLKNNSRRKRERMFTEQSLTNAALYLQNDEDINVIHKTIKRIQPSSSLSTSASSSENTSYFPLYQDEWEDLMLKDGEETKDPAKIKRFIELNFNDFAYILAAHGPITKISRKDKSIIFNTRRRFCPGVNREHQSGTNYFRYDHITRKFFKLCHAAECPMNKKPMFIGSRISDDVTQEDNDAAWAMLIYSITGKRIIRDRKTTKVYVYDKNCGTYVVDKQPMYTKTTKLLRNWVLKKINHYFDSQPVLSKDQLKAKCRINRILTMNKETKNLMESLFVLCTVDSTPFNTIQDDFLFSNSVIWNFRENKLISPIPMHRFVTNEICCDWQYTEATWEQMMYFLYKILNPIFSQCIMKTVFFLTYIGKCLAQRSKQSLAIIGPTDAGKSLLTKLLTLLCGSYYKPISDAVFTSKSGLTGQQAANLEGIKIATIDDPQYHVKWYHEWYKKLTGNYFLDNARRIYKQEDFIKLTLNLLIFCNAMGDISDWDKAAKNRFAMIFLNTKFKSDEDIDPESTSVVQKDPRFAVEDFLKQFIPAFFALVCFFYTRHMECQPIAPNKCTTGVPDCAKLLYLENHVNLVRKESTGVYLALVLDQIKQIDENDECFNIAFVPIRWIAEAIIAECEEEEIKIYAANKTKGVIELQAKIEHILENCSHDYELVQRKRLTLQHAKLYDGEIFYRHAVRISGKCLLHYMMKTSAEKKKERDAKKKNLRQNAMEDPNYTNDPWQSLEGTERYIQNANAPPEKKIDDYDLYFYVNYPDYREHDPNFKPAEESSSVINFDICKELTKDFHYLKAQRSNSFKSLKIGLSKNISKQNDKEGPQNTYPAAKELATAHGFRVEETIANGACLLNAYLQSQNIAVNLTNSDKLRKEIIDWISNPNVDNTEFSVAKEGLDVNCYIGSSEWSSGEHIVALHLYKRINVVTLNYVPQNNEFQVHLHYNTAFKETLFILRTENPGHFSWISSVSTEFSDMIQRYGAEDGDQRITSWGRIQRNEEENGITPTTAKIMMEVDDLKEDETKQVVPPPPKNTIEPQEICEPYAKVIQSQRNLVDVNDETMMDSAQTFVDKEVVLMNNINKKNKNYLNKEIDHAIPSHSENVDPKDKENVDPKDKENVHPKELLQNRQRSETSEELSQFDKKQSGTINKRKRSRKELDAEDEETPFLSQSLSQLSFSQQSNPSKKRKLNLQRQNCEMEFDLDALLHSDE